MRLPFVRVCVLLSALGVSSCTKSDSASEPTPVVVRNSGRALAEYRTVRASPWQAGKVLSPSDIDPRAPGPVAGQREPLLPADGRIGIIEGLEAGCRFLAVGRSRPNILVTYAQAGKTRDQTCNRRSDSPLPPSYPALFSFPDLHSGLYQPFEVAKCVADAMFQLATAVEPLHVTGGQLTYLQPQPEARYASVWYLSKRPEQLGETAQQELARVYRPNTSVIDPTAPWPADQTLYSLGVPSPSDAATWALLAVDYYRVAMMEAAWDLACPARDWYAYKFLDTPEQVTADDLRTMELIDSVNKLEEAAKLAQGGIEAAADARIAQTSDKSAALAENWVARFNSRLEGIRAYLPMPPQMFDGWRAVPLFRIEDPPPPGNDGYESQIPAWFSTDPYYWASAAYTPLGSSGQVTKRVTQTQCFIHTPEGPAPGGTIPFVTAADDTNSARALSYSLIDGLAGLDASGVVEFRLEGYLEQDTSRGATVPVMACNGTEGPYARWVNGCGACPPGSSGAGIVVGYAFAEYPARSQLQGAFPVVTASRQSEADRAAEHMLRITRVDPRLPEDEADQAVIDALVSRVARAYQEDHPGTFAEEVVSVGLVDVEAVLRLLGATREAFATAARRVTQQSLALGRSITPDASVTKQIPRVLGTEERWDSAEAVYYQALAQRSSHLARLYWPGASPSDLEIMRDGASDPGYFSMQHAYHGVYHAQAALLSVLRHDAFRFRQQGRLNSTALQALEAHLALNLEGWARVSTSAVSTAGAVGETSVALHDLRASAPDPGTAAAMYELWFGEAGLDCALGKTVCDEAHFRFTGLTPTVSNDNVEFRLFAPANGSVAVPAAANFLRTCPQASCPLRASVELRLYVTRRDPTTGFRKPLVGFTLDGLHPVVERSLPLLGIQIGGDDAPAIELGVDPVQFIPFVLGPASDDITGGVAPDPENPEDGETHCTGLKQITLEDELMEASTRKDDIESSFAYYLDVANEAAERADMLGEEVIRAGEAIDVRSEIARENLERLCGGVVNLERVQTLADAQGKDIATLLTERELDPSTGDTLNLQSDLAGLRGCLGLGEDSAPANVAVGEKPLCFWKFNSAGVELPPCVAPATLPDGTPIRLPEGDCPMVAPASGCTPDIYIFDPAQPYFSVAASDLNLNVTTGVDLSSSTASPSKQVRDAQAYSCMLRALTNRVNFDVAKRDCAYDGRSLASWFTHGMVKNVAERIGVRLEPFFVAVITLDGKDWVRFAYPDSGFSTAATWPCARFPELADEELAHCEDSILCGLNADACGSFGAGGAFTTPATENWLAGQQRFVRAAWIAKALGGASFESFQHYTWTYSSPRSKHPAYPLNRAKVWDSARGMGDVPVWPQGLLLIGQEQLIAERGTNSSLNGKNAVFGAAWYNGDWASLPALANPVLPQDAPANTVCTIPPALTNGTPFYASLAGGQWYRGARKNPAKKKSTLETWCFPLGEPRAGAGGPVTRTDALGDFCVETASRTRTANTAIDAFDANIGTAAHRGWIARQLERPSLDSSTHGPLTFAQDPPVNRPLQCQPAQGGGAVVTGQLPLLDHVGLAQYGFEEPTDLPRVSATSLADVIAIVAAANGSSGAGAAGCDPNLTVAPTINGPDDFPRLRGMLNCAAERVEGMVSQMMIPGLPMSIAKTAATGGVQTVVPTLRGEMGEASARLGGWLESYSAATATVTRALRDIGRDFEVIAAQLDINEDDEDLANLALTSKISASAAACASAVSEAKGPKGWLGGGIGSAAAICSDSVTQIVLATLANDAQQSILGEERKLILLDLAERVARRMDSIEDARRVLGEAHAKVSAQLAEIDSIRNQAGREVAKALGLESDDAGRVFPVSAVLRANYNTAKVRYQRALWQAKRAAHLARIALEQRVGVDLNDITDALPLVEAPSTWADTLCATTGIDYERIRKGNLPTTGTTPDPNAPDYNFAEASLPDGKTGFHFIGDYVTNLKRVRDSWSLAYPFKDGDDTVVISLRDDLVQTVQSCDVEGWNQLLQTATCMNPPSTDESIQPAWEPTCSTDACAIAFADSDTPLSCYAADGVTAVKDAGERCPGFGKHQLWPRAVRLHQTGVASPENGATPIETDEAGNPQPPQSGLEYWYRADDCTASAQRPGYIDSCRNRGANPPGQDRSLRSYGQSNITRIQEGIGGQPTLEAYTTLRTTMEPVERSAFTISVVSRAEADAQVFFWRGDRTMPNGTNQYIQLQTLYGPGKTSQLLWTSNASRSDSATLELSTPSPSFYPDVRPDRGTLVTLVSDGRASEPGPGEMRGVHLYLNGYLANKAETRLWTQRLGDYVFAPNGPLGGQLAEWLAYGRALTSPELSALHGYLAERYGFDLDAPHNWIEGDELKRIVDGGGTSLVSGFSGATNIVVDRALAHGGAVYGAGASAASAPVGLTSFGPPENAHYALELAGDDCVWMTGVGTENARIQGETQVRNIVPWRDLLLTFVARHDDAGRVHTLWWGDYEGRALKIDGASGAVSFHRSGVAYTSEPGLISPGVPFVLSLRSSPWREGPSGAQGTTEVFVNGRLAIAVDGAIRMTASRISSCGNDGIRGAVAEYQLHLQPASDASVRALHANLAAKYGIVEAEEGGNGDGDGGGDVNAGEGENEGDLDQLPTTTLPLYRQSVDARTGSYWLSWYQLASEPRLEVALSGDLALTEAGTYTTADVLTEVGAKYLSPGWVRHFGRVNVPTAGLLSVGWIVPDAADGVAFAAPQLERMSQVATVPPQQFFSTDEDRSAPRALCEDVNGEVFRNHQGWRRGVEYACDDELIGSCSERAAKGLLAPLRFREISFGIAQEAIDQGQLLTRSGFSRGNYNYRHKTVALNVVGTNVKKCENSQFPSNCQTSNFLQYSIRHDGRYKVRNHEGMLRDAPLFTGRIKQGKALLAERYLTNPISSGDRSLASSFSNEQFWGRPLDGNYVLRIYDADGLDWNAVEDVQLILNYRFWTRLD